MLAEAIDDGVKTPPPAPPKAKARRKAASTRGLFDRFTGWTVFQGVDGRSEKRARTNGPFDPRSPRGIIGLALVPGVLLFAVTMALAWNPVSAEPDVLSTIPVDVPAQTSVERRLIQNIGVLREGIWEAKLPPWLVVPSKGMARVSNPDVHEALERLFTDLRNFGDPIGYRAPPGVRRDRVFLSQVSDLRQRLRVIDAQLGGVRSITAYHLGLLSLWAGDAAGAESQFQSVVDIARKTEPLDDEGQQRLDGIEASAAYGLGLAQAARGLWKPAIASFDSALLASCRAAVDSKTNTQADFGYVLNRDNLVALDTRAIRNDRLVALLRARNAGDDAARTAVTSPTCAQLINPAGAPRGDADAEARALFSSLAIVGDPVFAANLQLRAALLGERDVVQQLTFDDASADIMQAQSLARAIVGLDGIGGANNVDKSALADLQKISVLKSRLGSQLQSGTLSEPEADPAWMWSDPELFVNWKSGVGSALAASLLARADGLTEHNPSLAAALYGVVIENRSWLPTVSVSDAWWRLNTGTSLAFVMWMLAISAAISGIVFLFLWRWRQTYRSTFESYHHDDRINAPEG